MFLNQDPYLSFWTTSTSALNPHPRTCTKKHAGRKAVWNEEFTIGVDDPNTEHFYLQVMNDNKYSDHALIGEVKFCCSDLKDTMVDSWVKIYRADGDNAGEVLISAGIQE